MISKIQIILLLLFINHSFSQSFITLDKDTNEFIENVNYTLFLKNKMVISGITKNDIATQINNNIEFDSISLSRIDYETIGISKQNIESVILLSKKIIYLDEIVIGSEIKNEIILGEKNRFVKSKSNSIRKGLDNGVVFENSLNKKLQLKKITFFVDKIKFKTEYKINVYEFKKTPVVIGHQYAELGKLIFSTKSLFLNPKQKNEIVINIEDEYIILNDSPIFISFELIANYDENNNEIQTSFEDSSKLKFQLSEKANYFTKLTEMPSGKLTEKMININAMINYDFAYNFFLKPRKSNLLAPAILLYAKQLD